MSCWHLEGWFCPASSLNGRILNNYANADRKHWMKSAIFSYITPFCCWIILQCQKKRVQKYTNGILCRLSEAAERISKWLFLLEASGLKRDIPLELNVFSNIFDNPLFGIRSRPISRRTVGSSILVLQMRVHFVPLWWLSRFNRTTCISGPIIQAKSLYSVRATRSFLPNPSPLTSLQALENTIVDQSSPWLHLQHDIVQDWNFFAGLQGTKTSLILFNQKSFEPPWVLDVCVFQ